MEPLYQGADGSGPECRIWLLFVLKEGHDGEGEMGGGVFLNQSGNLQD